MWKEVTAQDNWTRVVVRGRIFHTNDENVRVGMGCLWYTHKTNLTKHLHREEQELKRLLVRWDKRGGLAKALAAQLVQFSDDWGPIWDVFHQVCGQEIREEFVDLAGPDAKFYVWDPEYVPQMGPDPNWPVQWLGIDTTHVNCRSAIEGTLSPGAPGDNGPLGDEGGSVKWCW